MKSLAGLLLVNALCLGALTGTNNAKIIQQIEYEIYHVFITVPGDEGHLDADKYIYPENVYEENGEFVIEGSLMHETFYNDGTWEYERLERGIYRFKISDETTFTKRENRRSEISVECTCEEYIKDINEIPNTAIMLKVEDGVFVLAKRTE